MDLPADSPAQTEQPLENGNTTSERKRLANQRNSQHSTGPRSERGKHHSRTNAIKHGLFVTLGLSKLQHVPGIEGIQLIHHELEKSYPPRTTAEAIRLESIAVDIFRRNRAIRFEIEISELKGVFIHNAIDSTTRFSSAVARMTERSFQALEELDRAASAEEDKATELSQEDETDPEVGSQSEEEEDQEKDTPTARKPPTSTAAVTSMETEEVA